MNKMTIATKHLYRDTRGANLVEYIILVGVVALIALAGFRTFGKSVQGAIEKQAKVVQDL